MLICTVLPLNEELTTVMVAPWLPDTGERPVEDFCRLLMSNGKVTFDGKDPLLPLNVGPPEDAT